MLAFHQHDQPARFTARADFLFGGAMVLYAKPWLSINDQIDARETRGIVVSDRAACAALLRAVGYYRLSGYLYPFRESRLAIDEDGRDRRLISNQYRPGTSIDAARALIDFDRELRVLVLEGMERIEVSLRTQIGHKLGEISPFAHLDPANFVSSFTEPALAAGSDAVAPSRHADWIERVGARQAGSDEAFVAHFRAKYDDVMPIWALTEVLELGHLSRLYRGMNNGLATAIAHEYAATSKKILASWISSLNYARNVAAHHARLFNRKLVVAPSRPRVGQVPLLDHLRSDASSKSVFGVYNALAIVAFMLRSIDPASGWAARMRAVLMHFPEESGLSVASVGVPRGWASEELWAIE